jgi:hypothetical protein
VPLEKVLGRRVRGQPFIADRLDVPHLNVLIAMHSVIRPDNAAHPRLAPVWQGLWSCGGDDFMHPESTDLLAIAKRQLYLRTARGAFNESVEGICGI